MAGPSNQIGIASEVARIEALTGLRMIAVLAVFLSHTVTAAVPVPFASFFASGYSGVTLFFVLSGFVLAWNYADRLAQPTFRNVWSFAVARFARVYPIYFVGLVLVLMPSILKNGLPAESISHFLAVQAWSPDVRHAYAYNGPGWSIGVEFFLYACFPFIALLLKKLTTRGLVVLLAVAIAIPFLLCLLFIVTGQADAPRADPWSAHRWLYRTPLTRLPDFVAGAVVAVLCLRRPTSRPALAAAAQYVGLLGIAAVMVTPQMRFDVFSWDAAYLPSILILLWGLAAAPRALPARFLGTRPMVLLGDSSYAFYILHIPLLRALGGVSQATSFRQWLIDTGIDFGIIALVAVGAHIVIERPARRGLRRLLDRRRAPIPAAPKVAASLPA